MQFDTLLSGLIGAVVGGVLTGVFSICAANRTAEHNRNSQSTADAKILRGLLQALHDELESIYDRYQDTMGVHIESLPEGKPLMAYYPVINDFFTVYNSNASQIGRIEDNDLRKSLVRTYVLGKGLVDSFKMNNELITRFLYWEALFLETKESAHEIQVNVRHRELCEYAAQLKRGHAVTKASVQDVMRRLRKQGVLNEAAR